MHIPAGVVPALVTPLDAHGALLEPALREVIDFTVDNGVHGVFVLGSSGEIYGLDDAQKRRVVEVTVEHVAGRVPVYAGAGEITTLDCIRTASMVQSVGGVSALSVLTPYFLTPTQPELVDHYTAIARSTELPVVLYENSAKTHVTITPATLRTLSRVDNIVGIKDSSGDMTKMLGYLGSVPDSFSVMCGRDTMIYGALCHGAHGAIASTANLAPRLVVQIYESFAAGDLDRALDLQFALAPLRAALDRATFPVVLKEGLRLLGIDAGVCLAPAGPLTDADRRALRAVLNAIPVESTLTAA